MKRRVHQAETATLAKAARCKSVFAKTARQELFSYTQMLVAADLSCT